MKNNSRWMLISGMMGVSFFITANFTSIFQGSSVLAGILQIAVNAFVFIVWAKAFGETKGFKKFLAFFGVIGPVITAGITIWRVLTPFIIFLIQFL